MSDPSENGAGAQAVGTRWPELAIAAFLLVLAGLVIVDSLRTGTGWADDGPQSGYFPFRVGLLLAGACLWTVVGQLLRWNRTDPVFAQRAQLGLVVQVLVPIVVYVALIALLGIYVASALLIAYFMRRHGHYAALPTMLVSLGVPLMFFLVFERWFLVPLIKGPLERLLGF